MNREELIARMLDERPEPHDGFDQRIEHELVRLQAGREEGIMRRKMPAATVIAIVVALLMTCGAIAATLARNLIRDELSAGGAEDAANLVTAVHVQDAGDGFDFAIEEYFMEGDELFISWSASVPDDGNTYLLALYEPRVDGRRIGGWAWYIDEISEPCVGVLGGECMTEVSSIIRFGRTEADASGVLELSACFLKADRPVKIVDSWDALEKMFEEGDYGDVLNAGGALCALSDGEMPQVLLAQYREIEAQWHDRGIPDNFSFGVEAVLEREESMRLTAEDLEQAGFGHIARRFDLSTRLVRQEGELVYNGVAERVLHARDFDIEITRFHLSHISCEISMYIFPKEGMGIHDIGCEFGLLDMKGVPLNDDWSGWGQEQTTIDGRPFVNVSIYSNEVLPIGDADSFLLAPLAWDRDSNAAIGDMDNAVEIRPTLEQVWEDPDAVWANPNGRYYHRVEYCSGMHGAQRTTVEIAEAAGKQPCPVCAR